MQLDREIFSNAIQSTRKLMETCHGNASASPDWRGQYSDDSQFLDRIERIIRNDGKLTELDVTHTQDIYVKWEKFYRDIKEYLNNKSSKQTY